ncbi:hypothetical protein [Nocardioides jejuensis]|uniref:Sensor domain-containing protein n=1 Tax=Nocardioides jejuensis TaxID=2502782 RepID=A0A4R1CK58_9ACTN|nr:hypothetical protein [Nocardioides jejuensis]TCJ30785.1 hypothetical protein EPD65_01745 [Nocardioides jejuensis]
MHRSSLLGLLVALLVTAACNPAEDPTATSPGAGINEPSMSPSVFPSPNDVTDGPSASGGSYVPWEAIVDEATGIRFVTSSRMGSAESRKPRIQQQGTQTARYYEGGDLRFPDRLGMNVAIFPEDPRSAREVAQQSRSLAATAFSADGEVSPVGPVIHRPTAHEDAYNYELAIDLGHGAGLPALFTAVRCDTGTVLLETLAFGTTPNRRQLAKFHDAFRDGVRCPT